MDNNRLKEVSYYIISLILCLGFLVWVMQLWSATLTIPFSYSWDAIFAGQSIKGMIDTGWIFQNSYIGMPTGFFSYDYPTNSLLDPIIIKLISLIFPNWAFTLNIFFLLTFPLTTITAFFVFRQLNVSPVPAIAGILLFTFVPFHFLRGEGHLVLSSYFLIPLIVLVLFWIFDDDFLFSNFKKGSQNLIPSLLNKKTLISIFICIGIALEFVYYPFFSCFFLLIAGFYATLSRKKWSPLLNAGVLIGIIVLCILLSNLPTTVYQQVNGKNMEVAIRSPAESEYFGLKIIQLLLPVPGHRIEPFSQFSFYYGSTAPLMNENSEALGIIGAIGFLILIFWIFYQMFNKKSSIENETFNKITQISALNLSAILLATIGGFSSIIAYSAFSQLRAYNRISIFIAFFCIMTIVLLLDFILQKYSSSKTKKWAVIGFIVILLFFGLYDQTTEKFVPDYKNTKTTFLSDQQFIRNIEETFPNDTLVFQLPYVPFPENPPVNQMVDYDHFRAYLHSKNIHWSYGAMKGREGDFWQKEITSKSLSDMVNNLSFAGFDGLYVDSYGYADKGSETISSLTSILQTTPLVSDNKRLYFFDMTKYNNQLKSQWAPNEFAKQKDRILNPLQLEWYDGFSNLERNDGHNWRWSSSEGTLMITNPSDKERTILINTTFSTGYSDFSRLKIDGTTISENLYVNNQGYNYQKKIDLPPGKSRIKFRSDAKRIYAPGDPRYLVFHVDDFQITEIEGSKEQN